MIQFSLVAQLCLTLCDPMNHSMPGLPVHHQFPEFTQTHVHCVIDAIQPSHPLSSPSLSALNLSQHQGLFKWVSSSHQVAKVLEFQLQHQALQTCNRKILLGRLSRMPATSLCPQPSRLPVAWTHSCQTEFFFPFYLHSPSHLKLELSWVLYNFQWLLLLDTLQK